MNAEQNQQASPTEVVPYIDPHQIKKDLEWSERTLDDDMQRHSSLVSHYSVQSARAKAQHERFKALFEVIESRLYAKHRTALEQKALNEAMMTEATPGEAPAKKGKAKDGPARVTDAAVASAVKSDPLWWRAKQRVIQAEEIADLARDTMFNLVSRKDLMIEMARDRRKDREGEIRVQAARDARDMVLEALKRGGGTIAAPAG